MDIGTEHMRAYVYIEFKRGLSASEIFLHMQEAQLENLPTQSTVYRWCKAFRDGTRTSLNDAERCGRPVTALVEENIDIIRTLIEQQPKQSVRELAIQTNLPKNTIHRILQGPLGLRKLCSVWIPHELSQKNKNDRIACATEIINTFESNSMADCMKFWATQDETWVLYDSLPSKEENKVWMNPANPRPRIVRPKLTNRKTMLLFAFTGDGKCHCQSADPGETVTSEVYVDFIHTIGEKWRTRRNNSTKLCQLWWQHDNARPHTANNTKEFLLRRKVKIIRQSAYSPDLNQCDRWIFKDMKKCLRQRNFLSSHEILESSLHWFNNVPRDRFENELRKLIDHCKAVIECGGDYVTWK